MDKNDAYLSRQIIAYIGNKRRLLSLIQQAILSIYPEIPPGLKFLDAFAGSGVVSRLARRLGCEVHANDWEDYAYYINTAYLTIGASEVEGLFTTRGGLAAHLAYLNALPDPLPTEQYLARYYAPAAEDIRLADYRRERLFYTRSNALVLDKIRNKLEELYPPDSTTPAVTRPRCLLIALLLYQAATHTNTSGVFKAYHKGFGGHGQDALKRILSPITLPLPVLIDSLHPARVYCRDANLLVQQPELQGLDIAYLDPPYNQHQYGSNYHLLNTIARWDRIPAPLELAPSGVLKQKAAIRRDWIKTRSAYCYSDSAIQAFTRLIADLDARHILISYSTDGIIPFQQMLEICMKKGRVSLETHTYAKYRGGRQSNNRVTRNIEFIISIDTTQRSSQQTQGEIQTLLKRRELSLLLRKRYSRQRLARYFQLDQESGRLRTRLKAREINLDSREFFTLEAPPEAGQLEREELTLLVDKLQAACCRSQAEELAEIFLHLENGTLRPQYYLRLIPDILRKLAHKKYATLYREWLQRVKELQIRFPGEYSCIAARLEAVEEVAEKRFQP